MPATCFTEEEIMTANIWTSILMLMAIAGMLNCIAYAFKDATSLPFYLLRNVFICIAVISVLSMFGIV